MEPSTSSARFARGLFRLINIRAISSLSRLIADAMSYVDHDSYDLARLDSERRASAKRAALGLEEPG